MDQRIEEIKRDVAWLVEQGYSQAKVAMMVKVTAPHLSNILSGKVTPRDNTIDRIHQRIAEELAKIRGGGKSSFADFPKVLQWFGGLEAAYRKTVLDTMIATDDALMITQPVVAPKSPVDLEEEVAGELGKTSGRGPIAAPNRGKPPAVSPPPSRHARPNKRSTGS